jgi:hypothetical protein
MCTRKGLDEFEGQRDAPVLGRFNDGWVLQVYRGADLVDGHARRFAGPTRC